MGLKNQGPMPSSGECGEDGEVPSSGKTLEGAIDEELVQKLLRENQELKDHLKKVHSSIPVKPVIHGQTSRRRRIQKRQEAVEFVMGGYLDSHLVEPKCQWFRLRKVMEKMGYLCRHHCHRCLLVWTSTRRLTTKLDHVFESLGSLGFR